LDCETGSQRVAAWKKWREMTSLITNKSIPLKIRDTFYESCVRSVMLYGAAGA